MAIKMKPQDELLLELTAPCIDVTRGTRRAQAAARLKYNPANKEKREVCSNIFRFTSPLGPIEKEELHWYLERYYLWPVGVFKERASKIEELLPIWGRSIYEEMFQIVPACTKSLGGGGWHCSETFFPFGRSYTGQKKQPGKTN
jgi:hypothetical protein